MIRERLYLSQILCGACEKQTQFKVAAWDSTVPEDCGDEHFTQRAPMFQVRERSACCQRYLCHQFRALQLGVFPLQADADGNLTSQGDLAGERSGWPEGIDPVLVMEVRCSSARCDKLARLKRVQTLTLTQTSTNRSLAGALSSSAAGCPFRMRCRCGVQLATGREEAEEEEEKGMSTMAGSSSTGSGGTAAGLARST